MAAIAQPGRRHGRKLRIYVRNGLLLVSVGVLLLGGCTRRFYRKSADKEVSEVLAEKDVYEPWKIEQYHVYPDPRSRFADPTCPDRPPMPPDDPAAYDLAPRPQKPGKAGVDYIEGNGYLDLLQMWDFENRGSSRPQEQLSDVEAQGYERTQAEKEKDDRNPVIRRSDGAAKAFLLNLEQAEELGLINSREFQTRREQMYLTALPVTLQRFNFAAQFFATETIVRRWLGSERSDDRQPRNQWEFLTGERQPGAIGPVPFTSVSGGYVGSTPRATGIGFGKVFSTGAALLAQFANDTVVDLNSVFKNEVPIKHTRSVSTATLELVQPFLRGGGRAIALEPLTQAERELVYDIRSYARFRKEFYVNLAAGTSIASGGGQASVGGSLGTTGAGATGADLSLQTTTGLGVTANQGYLPTLLRLAQVVTQRANVEAFESFKRRFDALKEGGDVAQLQVDQVEQDLLNGRSNLLDQERLYRDGLDRFKIQLGLPVNVPLELDDQPIRPLTRQIKNFETVFNEFDAVRARAAQSDAARVPPETLRARIREFFTSSALVQGTRFQQEFPARWERWERKTNDQVRTDLRELAAERRKLQDLKSDEENAGRTFPQDQERRLTEVEDELALGSFEQSLRLYEAQPWRGQPDADRRRDILFRDVVNGFDVVLGAARNERLDQVRAKWPGLPSVKVNDTDLIKAPLEDAYDLGSQTAIVNRLDLMNTRAQLVDAWRQIAVDANSLLGVFNVRYHLDSTTPADLAKPFAFSGQRSRHELTLNGELPLVRQAERNTYRSTLIAYQRSRRNLMASEDTIVNSIRQEIRQLRVFSEQYEIQKRALELAYLNVEQSLDTFSRPPTPTGAAAPGSGVTSGEAAALTTQLINAQRSLPQAQNQLYSIWINYQVTRLNLYRDLELMPLDFRGVWIDDLATCQSSGGDAGKTDGASSPGDQRPDSRPEAGQPAEPIPPPTPKGAL